MLAARATPQCPACGGSGQNDRAKAPAGLSRSIARAKLRGEPSITIWGDGSCTRSFTWIEDCIDGIRLMMERGDEEPLNLGYEEQVSILQLVAMISDIAGHEVLVVPDMSKPQGVAGRNSDNTEIRALLGWEPKTRLRAGMEATYRWIEQKVKESME